MKHLTIVHRIMLTIGAAIVSLLLVGFVGLSVANRSADSIKKINDHSLAGIQILGDARQAFTLSRVTAYSHIFAADEVAKQNVEKTMLSSFEAASKLLKEYEPALSINPESITTAIFGFIHGDIPFFH